MISQNDIARAAGLERSTVSLALRNHPAIAKETRDRVRKIADSLGYHPNAALAENARQRWRQLEGVRREVVAFIPTRASDDHPILQAARSRLDTLGYGMTVIEPDEFRGNDPALSHALYHRGIRGVLMEQITDLDRERTLEWDKFCVVQCGLLIRTRRMHQVRLDFAGMVNESLRRVIEAGFQRIVFLVPNGERFYSDFLLRQAADGAQMSPMYGRKIAGVIAVEYGDTLTPSARDILIKLNPDVLLCAIPPYLEQALKLQPDVKLVNLVNFEGNNRWTGFAPFNATVGHMAAELLDSRLRANEFGLPAIPQRVTFVPEWMEGQD